MQDAQTYLEVVRSRGERGLELSRVYRNLRNKELFLRAYAKLYANKGALTPGTDPTDTVPRENRKPLVAKFGAKPIRFDKKAVINETKSQLLTQRNEMVSRLLANQCELCGSTEDIRVHHIRKLKDLKRRYEGRPDPPNWVVRMIELRRKTLVVCAQCHQAIHAGTYDGPRLK